MRPCICGKVEQCPYCRFYEQDATYRRLCDEGKVPQPKAPVGLFLNWAAALTVEMAWRARGGRTLTTEEHQQRRALCDACPEHDAEADRCLVCKCYLHARALPPVPMGKLEMATQKCPLDKWDVIPEYRGQAKGCGGCPQ
jgi:hypothetical protein